MKEIAVSLLIATVFIGGAFMLSRVGRDPNPGDQIPKVNVNNVTMVNGTQVIEIAAKGGYSPRSSTAQAGTPTVIKMVTRNTFDCSSALVIPSIGYRGNLPVSGTIEIPVPAQKAGTKLQGLCAMGMYSFTVSFR